MQLAVIAPTAYLEEFCGEPGKRRVQFALAQHCVERGPYFDYYRACVEKGSTVILDNGEYEGERLGLEDYYYVCKELQPTVAVAPDVRDDYFSSREMLEEFTSLLFARLNNQKRCAVMPVLQAHVSAPHLYIKHYYQCVCELSRYQWIGFPRCIPDRVEIVNYLRDTGLWRIGVMHHALGWTASREEIQELKPHFASMDTSGPVWRGLNGYTLTKMEDSIWPDYKFDVHATNLDTANAHSNLAEVESWLR